MLRINPMPKTDVIIIGAGLSGLTCARSLQQSRVGFVILESADDIGGRVRTDCVEGFRLDRGFQVFLEAYPEPKRWIHLEDLQLRSFYPGAQVWFGGRFHKMSDPFRRPLHAIGSLCNPIGGFTDKMKVAVVRAKACRGSLAEVFNRPERTTLAHLTEAGFSPAMIERFFRPFLGGIMLDRELDTSSRIFEFLFRMFAKGNSALPEKGMGELPKQLAAGLPADSIRRNSRVVRWDAKQVELASGEVWDARAVVIATEGPAAAKLTGLTPAVGSRSVQCHYYVGPRPPAGEPILFLDGTGKHPYNTAVFINSISPAAAPPGMGLLSVTALGERPVNEADARQQLRSWFGEDVAQWRRLREYVIPHAQPHWSQIRVPGTIPDARLGRNRYACGDYRWTASINGAMESGRFAAEAVLNDLGAPNRVAD